MHGHGHAPPQPGRPADGTLVVLRTLFVVLTVLSCGFLAWTPLLRLAVITRRALDWILFCVLLLSTIGMFVFLGETVPEDEKQEMSDGAALFFGAWVLVSVVGVVIYYLIAEIRHYGRRVPPVAAYGPPQATGYGYPPVAAPAAQTYPQPLPPQHQPHPPTPRAPAAGPVPTQPQPQAQQQPQPQPQSSARPTSHRIDQVRAELDELSDLLRGEPQDPREEGK
ncbi:hypothetical protein [Streptomyces gobitricini]|uniref:Integral membrane protein n=1 Tax=Streptomyces gobitricini TaxID=68211 RepID=A0ABP5ZGH0_9ACTN